MTSSFCLGLEEQAAGTVRPCISFEIRERITAALLERFEHDIVAEMARINADFRVALTEHRDGVMPIVRKTAQFNHHRHLIKALFRHPPSRAVLFRALTR